MCEHFIHPHVHDVVFADNVTLTNLSMKLTKHISDKDIHITKEEREKWNNKVEQSELEEVKKRIPVIDPDTDPSEIVIPTHTKQLINDSDFLSEELVRNLLSSYGITCEQDYSNFVNKDSLATINGQHLFEGGNINITNIKSTDPLFSVNSLPVYLGNNVNIAQTDIEVDSGSVVRIKFVEDKIELWRDGDELARMYIEFPQYSEDQTTDVKIYVWSNAEGMYRQLVLSSTSINP